METRIFKNKNNSILTSISLSPHLLSHIPSSLILLTPFPFWPFFPPTPHFQYQFQPVRCSSTYTLFAHFGSHTHTHTFKRKYLWKISPLWKIFSWWFAMHIRNTINVLCSAKMRSSRKRKTSAVTWKRTGKHALLSQGVVVLTQVCEVPQPCNSTILQKYSHTKFAFVFV